jgi:hypothetical protein
MDARPTDLTGKTRKEAGTNRSIASTERRVMGELGDWRDHLLSGHSGQSILTLCRTLIFPTKNTLPSQPQCAGRSPMIVTLCRRASPR